MPGTKTTGGASLPTLRARTRVRSRRRRRVPGAVALIGACRGKQPAPPPPAAVSPKTDDEKAVYALGAMLGTRFVQPLHLSPAELELLRKGLADTAQGGKPEFPIDEWTPKVDALARSRVAAGGAAAAGHRRGGG